MRFTTRMLVTQLAAAAAVIAVCAAAFAWIGVQQLRTETQSTALAIARTVASDPQLRRAVAEYAGDAELDAAVLADGEVQRQATEIARRTGALFVVVADDDGLRLAHPDPARLGERVSTEYERVLAGEEIVTWERGTLGESARAKVPVYRPGAGQTGPGGGSAGIVGEVSVGFAPASVLAEVPGLVAAIAAAVALAFGVAALAAFLIRRRLERLTLGVQPEELGALLQNQAAVLDGVNDGVVAVSGDGVVRAVNRSARDLLALDEAAIGRPLAELELPPALVEAIRRGLDGEPLALGELVTADHVGYVEARRVRRGDRDLGVVAVVRDRTDVVALAERLDAVRTATNALRAQRHEFANRMHAVSGLLAVGRIVDAQEFLAELSSRGAVPEAAVEAIDDPFLQALVGAKAVEAAERGVELRVADDTLLVGIVDEPEDVAAVLGNLVDNAVTAAVAGDEPRWVELSLLDDGDTLAVTISDSGRGVADPERLFAGRADDGADDAEDTDEASDRVHGRGIGLPLARRFARRRGGDLWLVDAGGAGRGAVFAARLPAVMHRRPTGDGDEGEVR
ncbi:ATP-binding protein [Agromyces sp. NPDC127015]|uniref:sensor histidine kinase n=1 Tax=Agromyces sp. NPDC127015 TaxID=3347108 RepID=UPI003662555C